MVAFDWSEIEGFHFNFREEIGSRLAGKQRQFNQNYAGYFSIPDTMIITNDDGTKSLAPDPLMSIRQNIVHDIMITLNFGDPDTISRFEGHIADLLMESNFSHTASNGRITQIRGEQQLIELAQQSLARNDRRIDLEINIEHWIFRKNWTPRLFFKIYKKSEDDERIPKERKIAANDCKMRKDIAVIEMNDDIHELSFVPERNTRTSVAKLPDLRTSAAIIHLKRQVKPATITSPCLPCGQ